MTREKLNTSNGGPLKKAPTLVLNKVVGSRAVGTFEGRYTNPAFPKKFNTLLTIEETDGSTTLWDKEKAQEVEVEVEPGDRVFIQESATLESVFSKLNKGDRIEIVYMGKGTPKPGQKPPYLYDIFKLGA